MPLLTDGEIEKRLKDLRGWSRDGDAISKEYKFRDFVAAIAFVRRVADRAEEARHHPDIEIHYNKVRLTLSTHSEGGITEKDTAAASSFNDAVE